MSLHRFAEAVAAALLALIFVAFIVQIVLRYSGERTEGARACAAGDALARKHKIRMPLLSGVAAVLAGKIEPKDAAKIAGEAVASEE